MYTYIHTSEETLIANCTIYREFLSLALFSRICLQMLSVHLLSVIFALLLKLLVL